MSETLTITTPDGDFSAYVARPQADNAPAIVVIQEIFGVNKVMRDICDGLAAQGYVAICPDLFWRIEPGIDITDQSEAEWKRAFELFNAFDVDAGVGDIAATNYITHTGRRALHAHRRIHPAHGTGNDHDRHRPGVRCHLR